MAKRSGLDRGENVKDIIFLLSAAFVIYIISRIILKEPILPWKQKKNKAETATIANKKNKKGADNGSPLDEEEAAPFEELFPDVESIGSHMIRQKDNTFTMIAEVTPVNYFLLDQSEQEGIDATFETWLAQLNYGVRIYLQNRFVDLTLPVEEMQKVMNEEDTLHPLAYQYGQDMIRSLRDWQSAQPRFETKRYLIFDYKVESKDVRAESKDDFEEKVIEKAFNELRRRLSTAQTQLRKADILIEMLPTDGIGEVLYYAFNRRKAVKNYYRDIERQEQLALFVTADQDASRIIRVKGELENAEKDIQTEEAG